MAMPYRILINGQEIGRIDNGDFFTTIVPENQFVLKVTMVGNSMNLHKVEKQIVISPEMCRSGVIHCTIVTKLNMMGLLSSGLLERVGNMDIQVAYL